MKIGLIVGSLRKDSWNKKVALTAKKLFPKDIEVELIDISKVALYNEDLDGDKPDQEYENIRQEVKKYDGYIFFTPEYNRSYAPAIKNIIDIGSKAKEGNIWANKPATVFSASTGDYGGIAGNLALRQVLVCVNLIPMQRPEIYLAKVDTLFDENGEMVEKTKKRLEKAVLAFVEHVKLIKANN